MNDATDKDQKQNFREYHGAAAENLDAKANPDGKLKIVCPEITPFYYNELKHKEEEINFTCEDIWKTRQASSVKSKNTIEAFFKGSNSSISMPDIHLGEQVIVTQYAKENKYYWTPFRKDEQLRQREHYRIFCLDSPTRIKQITDDNTYYIEINTKQGEKGIKIRTSKSDGEAFKYNIDINCETSMISIKDDAKNSIILDSKNTKICLTNAVGTKVDLDKENLFLIAKNNLILKAKNLISVKSDQLVIDHKQGLFKVVLAAIKNCGRSMSC